MFDSPRKLGMLAGSLAFMVLFPLYFAWMPLADEGLASGGRDPKEIGRLASLRVKLFSKSQQF